MSENEGQLEVTVAPGFAETEYYVMVQDGPAAFVNRDLVSVAAPPTADTPVEGRVKVYVLDQGDHDALIELPGEAVVGGLRARVSLALLQPA